MEPSELVVRREILADALQREHAGLAGHMKIIVRHRLRHRTMAERREAAAELMQSTAERALRDAHLYDPQRAPLPWLIHLSHYVLAEQSVRRGRDSRQRSESSLDERLLRALHQASHGDPTPALHDHHDGARVRRLVQAMPEAQRRILTLRYFEDRDGKEVAALLGISHGAARIRLARALQELREAFFAPAKKEVAP